MLPGGTASCWGGPAVPTSVSVTVQEQGADATALDELAGLLRQELLALDVNDVTRARGGQAPRGTRGLDVQTVGALVVTLQGSVTVLDSLVRAVRTWLGRGPEGRSVELTVGDAKLTLSRATMEQQDRIVEQFLRATAGT